MGPLDLNTQNLLRGLTPQVLGILTRRFHDFAAAEDALQEALLAAATQWPSEGTPANPRAWLTQVASRRLTDQIRADIARRHREQLGYPMPEVSSVDEDQDDTLILLFMCCHPALTPSSAIALTLRAVGGLTTAQIARAFLVPEATMAQRISRAKQTIRTSGVPFALPEAQARTSRLREVLHVLYLIFSEGYTSSEGESLQRHDLSHEAIRLARLTQRITDDAEATGLLALMLLTDARRPARTGQFGEMIPLPEQDRLKWDRGQIAEGVELLSEALSRGTVGPYQLQAAVAALHDEAVTHEATDWPQILVLYELLRRMSDNPMVSVNHAVAFAMVHGPAAGLELLHTLEADPRLAANHRLAAVRAHLLEMSGEFKRAVLEYQAAAAKTASLPERNYLLGKAAALANATL
ncbi:MAG: polymerase subunit sigma-24 [Bryobacterales bacterium]|nr:polymerase subunit sigma-24 [Bryobacterales bacterium]